MTRGRVRQVMVRRQGAVADGGLVPDEVVTEEPLELRLDDTTVNTTMRTPGHDFELAAGWCLTEGLLADAPLADIRYCATGSATETAFNVVSLTTRGGASNPQPRLTTTTSSCGICGSTSIDDVASRLVPLVDPAPAAVAVLDAVLTGVSERQELFRRTGSTHAAAAFSLEDGAVIELREDIGRHNAADKVIGRLLLDGRLPASRFGLYLSGRVSLEMVQKAWAAGFPLVVAVGGPSSLAIELAARANITLVAFARDERLNVYTGALA